MIKRDVAVTAMQSRIGVCPQLEPAGAVFDAMTNTVSNTPDLGTTFANTLQANSIGALTGVLTTELAASLHLNGDTVGERLFGVAATTVTSHFITSAVNDNPLAPEARAA